MPRHSLTWPSWESTPLSRFAHILQAMHLHEPAHCLTSQAAAARQWACAWHRPPKAASATACTPCIGKGTAPLWDCLEKPEAVHLAAFTCSTQLCQPGSLRPACNLLLLQDSQDPNPLIRALAVRTMGCIRVDKITEYLCDPLQRCLKVQPCSSKPEASWSQE